MSAFIRLEDLSVKFRVYGNTAPDLKTSVIQWLTRQTPPERYHDFYALKGIQLSISEGERVGVIGLNGAGKTTLFKTLAGIYPPTQGSITLCGSLIPLLELGTGFDYELSGLENIYLNGAIFGNSPERMKELEAEIIAFSELGDHIHTPIKYYSSGMISRLAFSIASSITPEILLMDEVFAVGDAHFVSKATARIHELIDASKIFMIISHQMGQIVDYCTRAVILHQGEIVGDGKPAEIVDQYYRTIVKDAA